MNTPQPDPTNLTTEQLRHAINNERDFLLAKLEALDQRFAGIDEATKVLHETVTRTPTVIEREVRHLRELDDEKFHSVSVQLEERRVQGEQERRASQEAIGAAFAAAALAAAKQDEANSKAIDKSEKATNETITKNADASAAAVKALNEKVDDLKEQFIRDFSRGLGSAEQKHERRELTASTIAIAGFVLSVIVAVGGIAIGAR